MFKKITLLSTLILAFLGVVAQETPDDGLTDKERAFRDSIAAVNAANAENAEAMEHIMMVLMLFNRKIITEQLKLLTKRLQAAPILLMHTIIKLWLSLKEVKRKTLL